MRIETAGIHHVTLRVTDLEASGRFYEGVLGFAVQRLAPDIALFQVGPTLIVLRPPLPGTPAGDRFSEHRIGVDHIALAVGERRELDKVLEALRKGGVPTKGVEREPILDKDYVCFRDPDNVQWEFYCMPLQDPVAGRRAQLRSVAEAYFDALRKKDFSLIPYDERVVLRAPLAPGGVNVPLVGKEALRTVWWPPLVPAVGSVEVLEHYINEAASAICSEALVQVVAVSPPATLRVADRFTVNTEGKILEQENHFDPRDVTNPGWQKG